MTTFFYLKRPVINFEETKPNLKKIIFYSIECFCANSIIYDWSRGILISNKLDLEKNGTMNELEIIVDFM